MPQQKGPRPRPEPLLAASQYTRFGIASINCRTQRKAARATQHQSLAALLYNSREELAARTVGNVFADHADIVARGKSEVIRFQQFRVTQMHVHLSGSSLNHHMGSEWSGRGILLKANHRALQRNLSAHIVGAHLLRSALRLLLRVCATAKQEH